MAAKPQQVEVTFLLADRDRTANADVITAHMERAELLFGVTFIVLAPSHPLAQDVKNETFTGKNAINPLNQEQIPVWVADCAGANADGGVHLGVPAHDGLDNHFAREHGLPIVPVVAQDFGKPLPDVKDVTGVVVICYDPKTKQYMGLKNGQQGWLVGGGREAGESYEEAARRELTEEAGFSRVIDMIPLGDPIYSYYYNDIKRSNRRSLGYNYLAIVDRATQHEQQQEAHESFTIWWTEFDELFADIKKTDGGVEHWLEALQRAKTVADAYDDGAGAGKSTHTFECYKGDGTMLNSGPYDGLSNLEARKRITKDLKDHKNHKDHKNLGVFAAK